MPHFTEENREFWDSWESEKNNVLEAKIRNAKREGWHTIRVWDCELTGDKAYDTVQRIEKELRVNQSRGRHKEYN